MGGRCVRLNGLRDPAPGRGEGNLSLSSSEYIEHFIPNLPAPEQELWDTEEIQMREDKQCEEKFEGEAAEGDLQGQIKLAGEEVIAIEKGVIFRGCGALPQGQLGGEVD